MSDERRPKPEQVRPPGLDEARAQRRAGGSAGPGVVSGTLGGDSRLEGGCVWLDTGGGRYDVVWPDGFTAETDPVRLLRDGEVIAEAGDRLTVHGQVDRDAITFRQIGPVFRATRVDPQGD